MRRRSGKGALASILPLCCLLTSVATGAEAGVDAGAEAQPPPSYRKLRYEEDYDCPRDESRREAAPARIKCLRPAANGDARLSLGGEARVRYELLNNPTFGQDPQDDYGVFLQRYALHGDWRPGSRVRLFGQLFSALETGREGGPSPVDENELELQNAFVDLELVSSDGAAVTFRGGRQELSYGSERIVGVREGPNVRRTFDGARLLLELADWRIDALYARPRSEERGVFDDETRDDQALWGVYAAGRPGLLGSGGIDVYYLGFEADDARFAQGAADETRHSVGLRAWGARGPWDWNWETLYQFGSCGAGDIGAWTLATDTGYTWHEAPWTPRLAINTNIASGDDDPGDPDLGTFNALYPRGSYFSEAAVLGPRNFFNFHVFLTLEPAAAWSVTADVNFFWRLETEDGVYGPAGQLIRSGSGSDERFVGSALSLTSAWRIDRHFTFTAIYSHFFPGRFIDSAGPSGDIDFLELTLQFRF